MPATANFTQTRALSGGNLDDGYWNIELPWPIYFLNGSSFGFQGDPNIHVTTNGIIAPGLGTNNSTAYVINASTPNINKLVIAAADNYISKFQYKVIGTTPNRKAYIRYEGYQFSSTFADTPIIWEVVFSEQQSNQPTFIDVNVISNSRWGTQALYGLYAVGGTLVENPTNFGQPGLAWRLDLWYTAGLYVRTAAQQISTVNVSKYGSLPGENLSANRTLFIAGNDTNNFGTGSGVMMISKSGMPPDSLANPQPYVQDLYFHSGLPYVQITAQLISAEPITFLAVARTLYTWSDGGGGGGCFGGDACFAPNSEIAMFDGTKKLIKDVQIGDLVWNKDKTSGNKVTFIENASVSNYLHLYSHTANLKPFATFNHPLFIDGKFCSPTPKAYIWLDTEYIEPVNIAKSIDICDTVYNLWTTGDHTYIVNDVGTHSIVDDGGAMLHCYQQGLITHSQCSDIIIDISSDTPEHLYGAYLINKFLKKFNYKLVNKLLVYFATSNRKTFQRQIFKVISKLIGTTTKQLRKL